MVEIPVHDKAFALYKTHLYNVTTYQFDEVAVMVSTGSNVVFVDLAYCTDLKPCEAIRVDSEAGTTSYSQQGVAVIRGKQNQQNIGFEAFASDMSGRVCKGCKLMLSASAANRLGILLQPAVHQSTPVHKLCELPVDQLF